MGAFEPRWRDDEDYHGTFVTLYAADGELISTRRSTEKLFRACTCTLELIVVEAAERGPTVELRALAVSAAPSRTCLEAQAEHQRPDYHRADCSDEHGARGNVLRGADERVMLRDCRIC
jgi:hypothetical protein